ncbi:SDR family NAD(P)-dependent oxidoreductase [Kitasatospora sp. NPDC052896]|uniref:SDR family NAD(P)-dependent oxidoreductase n=1 Tax=Kitasatospora sp. NPDC052896 TaxID=3364061 RepID=UPI0037CADFC4
MKITQTILITGATQGLGRQLALELARSGAGLLLHGRDADRLAETVSAVRAARATGPADGGTGATASVRTYLADLADLDQVHALAQQVLAREPRLDVLVNNAAIGAGRHPEERELSAQGHELRLAVNHLAPHALTRALLPLLAASTGPATPARVVNVASMGQAPIDLDDVMFERGYDGLEAYCRSKLAMIMSTFDLAAALDRTPDAPAVTVNAVHPAHLMDTRAVREAGLVPAVDIAEGVRPTARLVTDPALASVSGRYFDRFTEARAHEQAYDPAARSRLAALTAALTAPR